MIENLDQHTRYIVNFHLLEYVGYTTLSETSHYFYNSFIDTLFWGVISPDIIDIYRYLAVVMCPEHICPVQTNQKA